LEQGVRAGLGQLGLRTRWTCARPTNRLRRLRPLRLLLGVGADEDVLDAGHTVGDRGDELLQLRPTVLLRLALARLLGQLVLRRGVAEGCPGRRFGREVLDQDSQSPPRQLAAVDVEQIDAVVVAEQVGL
jgi:hypothetical protein